MRRLLITTSIALTLAGAATCLAFPSSNCRPNAIDRIVPEFQIHNPASSIAAFLIDLGRQTGVCIGIEIADDKLLAPLDAAALPEPGGILRSILVQSIPAGAGYTIEIDDGVILIRQLRAVNPPLDVTISSFDLDGRGTLAEAGTALHIRVRRNLDSSIQGIAGTIHNTNPNNRVTSIHEKDRTARFLLDRIVQQSTTGAAWIAGGCDAEDFKRGQNSCWAMLAYDSPPERFADLARGAVSEVLVHIQQRNEPKL